MIRDTSQDKSFPASRFWNTLRQKGLIKTLRYIYFRLYDNYYRRHLGIRSYHVVTMQELSIDNKLYNNHAPTHYIEFKKIMQILDIKPEDHTFLDFGSGMGCAVRMAAAYPFQKVIGVEISSDLNSIALELINREKEKLKCKNVELVVSEATSYSIPKEISVFYFYNPFHGEILEKTLKNIRNSLETYPRKVYLIAKQSEHFDKVSNLNRWVSVYRSYKTFHGQLCTIYCN